MAPGAEVTKTTTEYTVTEADILAEGSTLQNVAVAKGTDPTDPEGDPIEEEGSTEDPKEDPAPSLKVEKSLTTVNGTAKAKDYKVKAGDYRRRQVV